MKKNKFKYHRKLGKRMPSKRLMKLKPGDMVLSYYTDGHAKEIIKIERIDSHYVLAQDQNKKSFLYPKRAILKKLTRYKHPELYL